MQSRPSRWQCEPYDVGAALRLADGLGVSQPVAAVLARRGLHELDEARAFLAADERHDPLTLPGAPAACELILAHVRRGSRIVVFGDYDVDGVCSTAILLRALRALGADPAWQLPSRFEDGYGLSEAAVQRLAAQGRRPARDGRLRHHRGGGGGRGARRRPRRGRHRPSPPRAASCPTARWCTRRSAATAARSCAPRAWRSSCPRRCGPPRARTRPAREEDLDLAALATVCDLVPLRGENRRIVREGLRELARTRKPGLRALMRVGGLEPGDVDEGALGFRLGPRLNAAGRMQRADAALELLTTESEERAGEIADELDLLNRDRREAETRILFAAEAACAAQASPGRDGGGRRGLAPGRGGHRGLAAGRALAPPLRGHRPRRRHRAAARAAASPPTTCTRASAPAPSTWAASAATAPPPGSTSSASRSSPSAARSRPTPAPRCRRPT